MVLGVVLLLVTRRAELTPMMVWLHILRTARSSPPVGILLSGGETVRQVQGQSDPWVWMSSLFSL